jgi:carbonic anhydrase
MDAIELLVERAVRLGSAGVPTPPRLKLAIVTCMDSRIDLFQIFGLERGEAHVLRNAGGVVTDDVIRSLILSQRYLGTEQVMLIHHTRCGAHGLPEEEVKEQLQAETGIRPPFSLESFSDLDADVRQSMERIRQSPFIRHDNVRGFVLDVDDGSLGEIV